MDEATWAASPDPFEMLNVLRASGRGSDRKLRLVCCALCRAVEHLLTDGRYRAALDVAERYADGLAGAGELRKAHGVVCAVSEHTEDYEWSEDKQAMLLAANAVGWATCQREPPDPPAYLAGCAAAGAKAASVTEGLPEAEVLASQSALLRDILGNPFVAPPRIDPIWLAWNNGTAKKLAQATYEGRSLSGGTLDNSRLAVLADALEEAGCDNEDVLFHCREQGKAHVRGCWVLDLILGKE
jgi:hypothetical protein